MNLKSDARDECVYDLQMDKFYIWINAQELFQRREKKKMTLLYLGFALASAQLIQKVI